MSHVCGDFLDVVAVPGFVPCLLLGILCVGRGGGCHFVSATSRCEAIRLKSQSLGHEKKKRSIWIEFLLRYLSDEAGQAPICTDKA